MLNLPQEVICQDCGTFIEYSTDVHQRLKKYCPICLKKRIKINSKRAHDKKMIQKYGFDSVEELEIYRSQKEQRFKSARELRNRINCERSKERSKHWKSLSESEKSYYLQMAVEEIMQEIEDGTLGETRLNTKSKGKVQSI